MKFQSQFPSQSIHPLTFIYTTKKIELISAAGHMVYHPVRLL